MSFECYLMYLLSCWSPLPWVLRTTAQVALGLGFRCGFLGVLHMEVVKDTFPFHRQLWPGIYLAKAFWTMNLDFFWKITRSKIGWVWTESLQDRLEREYDLDLIVTAPSEPWLESRFTSQPRFTGWKSCPPAPRSSIRFRWKTVQSKPFSLVLNST